MPAQPPPLPNARQPEQRRRTLSGTAMLLAAMTIVALGAAILSGHLRPSGTVLGIVVALTVGLVLKQLGWTRDKRRGGVLSILMRIVGSLLAAIEGVIAGVILGMALSPLFGYVGIKMSLGTLIFFAVLGAVAGAVLVNLPIEKWERGDWK